MTATHHEPATGAVSAPPADQGRVLVEVWQPMIRLVHWSLVASVVTLTLTGLYIGTPVLAPSAGPDALMSYVHTIHVGAGYVFTLAIVLRVILAFVGNRYARWDQLIPVRPAERRKVVPMIRYYFLRDKEPPSAVGHNPLAGMTYAVVFLLFVAQAFTGLALESLEDRGGLLWSVSGWVYGLAGTGTIRLVHHLILWFTWAFVIQHLYAAVLMDNIERSGLVSSMITGRKSVRRGEVE